MATYGTPQGVSKAPNSCLPPRCRLGGAAPHANGCPTDAAVVKQSKAWPVCLAKSPDASPDPYGNGHFHCLLVCPCEEGGSDGCGARSHEHCPRGARCQRGELRNVAHGVCTYPHDDEETPA